MATVEEVGMAVAEKVDDGRGGLGLCRVSFFSPIIFLTIIATATEGQGNGAVSSHKAPPGRVILVAVLDAPLSASALPLLLMILA